LKLTLEIFQQIPPLWIWDNIEPVNGFPSGTNSAWSLAEQRELKTFLQIVTGQTKTKFLLTSRRDEREWLGDVPMRVTLPPMPMQERVQLTRALADKQGKRIAAVKDWLPLLRFTQGNPLTITVIAGQALRDGISSAKQIEEYLRKLHTGEQTFSDENSEKRELSLAASLKYGFEQAFSEDERKVLALLHFFQGFVYVQVLRLMVADEDWGIGSKDFTDEKGIALLDKAADIGLLTAHGGGYYTIHPALPWFFRSLFEQYYPNEVTPADQNPTDHSSLITDHLRAKRAFVESMGELGNYYHDQYEGGNRDVIAPLRSEEPNLLHAHSLALRLARELAAQGDTRQHGWWMALIKTMQGLSQLYDHTGRRAEWKRLVEEIVPNFVGADDLPLSGREEGWRFVIEYLTRLAMETRQWNEAERYMRKKVEFARSRAVSLLARPAESLSAGEKNTLRMLAASLHELGEIQREMGQPDCLKNYEESLDLLEKIGERTGAATCAFNLGHAYKDLPALRNLDEAESWYQRCYELSDVNDRKVRGLSLHQLSLVAYQRFSDGKKTNLPNEELANLLRRALDYSNQALSTLPPDAVDDLAVTHNQLGIIYSGAGDLDRALEHYNKSVQYKEMTGNIYAAGNTRFNIANMFSQNGRLPDALLYARAALRNFESYGGRAKDMEDMVKGLIGEIEKLLNHD
jgi:tetratricopeptide (TPR) repeat protein